MKDENLKSLINEGIVLLFPSRVQYRKERINSFRIAILIKVDNNKIGEYLRVTSEGAFLRTAGDRR